MKRDTKKSLIIFFSLVTGFTLVNHLLGSFKKRVTKEKLKLVTRPNDEAERSMPPRDLSAWYRLKNLLPDGWMSDKEIQQNPDPPLYPKTHLKVIHKPKSDKDTDPAA